LLTWIGIGELRYEYDMYLAPNMGLDMLCSLGRDVLVSIRRDIPNFCSCTL